MNDPVLSVRIKNDKEGPQTGDVLLNGSAINQWEPGNQYDAGDVAVYNNQFYQSLVEQTAEQTFEPDKWQQIGIPDIIINEFEPDTFYYANQAITYDDKLYKAKADFTSGSRFYPEDWDAISGDTYSFTSEDRTVTITLNDNSVDFSVGDYVTGVKNELDAKFDNKVDKEPNKGLSSNDYTTDEKTKLQNLVSFFSVGDNLVLDADGRLNAGFSVSFDPALDKNSTNGIQNKPVAEAVEDLQSADAAMDGRITANTNNISANAANIVRQGADITQLQSDVAAQDIAINNKVDKEAGKELSSNDYTDADQTKLNGLANIRSIGTNLDLTNGVLSAPDQLTLQSTTGTSTVDGMTQKAITDAIAAASAGITTTLATVATSGDYDDLINIPTGETLTIKKNGSAVGTFSTLTGTDSDIDITVPVSAADIGALPASTKYAADLSLTINSSTFVMTAKLIDQAGNDLGTTQTIDLPLESVVVSGRYDSSTKKVILTLQNGSTVEFSIADLISGLQSEITDYTAGKQYIVGDICIFDGSFYRCLTPIASAPATMNDSDWEQVGGADAIVVELDDTNWTWTSDYSYTDIQDAVGKQLIFFKIASITNEYWIATRQQNNTSNSSLDFFIETRIRPSASVGHLMKVYSIQIKTGGVVSGHVESYSAAGDSTGKAKQTVGTLTIEKSDHTSIGTFNGSSDQTITLPESFEVLTNTEIDNIWSNA